MCSPEITRFLFSRENLPTIVRKRREVYEDSIFIELRLLIMVFYCFAQKTFFSPVSILMSVVDFNADKLERLVYDGFHYNVITV